MEQIIMINPNEQKYWINEGRYKTTRHILGKQWRRAHLIFSWYHHLSLKKLEIILHAGYCIHHKDENPLNDFIENLILLPLTSHTSHHLKGKQRPNLRGKTRSIKTRQKMSEMAERREAIKRKLGLNHYRHLDLNQILKKVLIEKKTLTMIAKEFNVGATLIHNRLYEVGYHSIKIKGSNKYTWQKRRQK